MPPGRGQDGLAFQRQPALACRVQAEHQILHPLRVIVVELRSRWDRDPQRHLAAAGAFTMGRRLGRIAHAARLDVDGRPFSPVKRALSSCCAAASCFNCQTLPSCFTSRASSSGRIRSEGSAVGGMPKPNCNHRAMASPSKPALFHVLPQLQPTQQKLRRGQRRCELSRVITT